ncbi:MAG: histidine--tRNA ligase [Cyclobacteriaceae bacterium]
MSTMKPSLPKGTRDFGPEKMQKRNFIFSQIREVFQLYGFLPLETPAMENLSVLTGKYGDEGDQLLFKVLNSGEYLKKTQVSDYEEGEKQMLPLISEKGLKYDLTVPFARYVVMNRNDITFPFKRYQMQPVWRADRPQRGRYREFYQCDADVIGTDSLVCETDIVSMINDVFQRLGLLDFTIKYNNRKILSGIAEALGHPSAEGPLCVAIDKLDKIGLDKVLEELGTAGFEDAALAQLRPILDSSGPSDYLKNLLLNSEIGKQGLEEVEQLQSMISTIGDDLHAEFDPTLARGLSYYTGSIFEVKINNIKMGSVCGGGRYDNLTGIFGLEGVSGVGISFGVDRLYDVMEELELFPADQTTSTQVLISTFDETSRKAGLKLLSQLRKQGFNSELYPDFGKMKKHFQYADKKNIPFVVIIGSEELEKGLFSLKEMSTGEQQQLDQDHLLKRLKK